jgi:hypothetical protein
MEKLSKNELFLFAVELDYPDLVNFCLTNKKINEKICRNEEFWFYKLKKEFPDYYKFDYKNKTSREMFKTMTYRKEFYEGLPFMMKMFKYDPIVKDSMKKVFDEYGKYLDSKIDKFEVIKTIEKAKVDIEENFQVYLTKNIALKILDNLKYVTENNYFI